MKNVSTTLLAGIFALAFLSGCAVGRKQDLSQAGNGASVIGTGATGRLNLGVNDQRPYVLSGDKSPSFVGLQRGGYGNPFDVKTASGNALSTDIGLALESQLTQAGFKVNRVELVPGSQQALELLATKGPADHVVMLKLVEWKTDTYQNTALHHDLELVIADAKGAIIATSRTSGRDNLGGSFLDPQSQAQKAAPEALLKKIETLFQDKSVRSALRLN